MDIGVDRISRVFFNYLFFQLFRARPPGAKNVVINVARYPPLVCPRVCPRVSSETPRRRYCGCSGGQLEMPCKQNRYLILTKPRPHKRIFSDSRWFCNESPSRSPPLSVPPLSSFSTVFPLSSPLLSQPSSSLCLVSAT